MFDIHHLVYGAPDLTGRFDDLIVHALLKLDPRLRLRQQPPGETFGEYAALKCGARFNGLLGDACIIEHAESGAFKVVDYQDSDWSPAVQLAPAPEFRGALYTMFHRPNIEQTFGEKAHMVRPGYFLDQLPLLTRSFRAAAHDVRQTAPLDERLHFRGTILTHRHGAEQEGNGMPYQWRGKLFRQAAVVLKEKYPDEVHVTDAKLPRREWFLEAARHRMVLALPGHPWCYREFEMFNLGIPLVSYPWNTHVEAAALPIPGVHYVATRDLRREPPGFAVDPEEGADAIMQAFRVARDGPMRTEEIGRAGQKWYDWALSPEAIAAGVLQFLNLDSPEWHAVSSAAGALAPAQPTEAD